MRRFYSTADTLSFSFPATLLFMFSKSQQRGPASCVHSTYIVPHGYDIDNRNILAHTEYVRVEGRYIKIQSMSGRRAKINISKRKENGTVQLSSDNCDNCVLRASVHSELASLTSV